MLSYTADVSDKSSSSLRDAVVQALWRPVSLIVRHRKLLYATTWTDVRARYAGSILGLGWLLLYPLLLLSAYSVVYIFIFRVKFAIYSTNEYVLLIFCGLIPFIGFSESLGMGVSSVTTNGNLVKNTLFPIDLIPVKAALTSQCTQLVGMALLMVALAIAGRLTPWCLAVIPIWVCQVLCTCGILWVLSSLNVFFRDLQNIIPITIMLLMMTSPIAYTEDMVPEKLLPFLKISPLYYFIISYQDCLMLGRCPRNYYLVVLVLMTICSLAFGHFFFRRLKGLFADSI